MRRMPPRSGNTKSKGNGAQTGALSTHPLSRQDCRFHKVLYHIPLHLSTPNFRKEDKNMKTNRTMEELQEYLKVRQAQITEWNQLFSLEKFMQSETIDGGFLERTFGGQGAATLMHDLQEFLKGKDVLDNELIFECMS